MSIYKYEIAATFECVCGRLNQGAIEYSTHERPTSIGCRYCDEYYTLDQLSRASVTEYAVGTRYYEYGEELDEYGEPLS